MGLEPRLGGGQSRAASSLRVPWTRLTGAMRQSIMQAGGVVQARSHTLLKKRPGKIPLDTCGLSLTPFPGARHRGKGDMPLFPGGRGQGRGSGIAAIGMDVSTMQSVVGYFKSATC